MPPFINITMPAAAGGIRKQNASIDIPKIGEKMR